jgi:hypothetical protein
VNFNSGDARHRRALFNFFYECHETLAVAFGHDLDRPVFAIADISLQAESASNMLNKVPETDSLDSPVHNDVFALQSHDRCEGWGARNGRGRLIRTSDLTMPNQPFSAVVVSQ